MSTIELTRWVELRRGVRCESRLCVPDGRGLLVEEGTWSRQRYLEPGSTLLVLCSHPYDPDTYLPESPAGEPETPA